MLLHNRKIQELDDSSYVNMVETPVEVLREVAWPVFRISWIAIFKSRDQTGVLSGSNPRSLIFRYEMYLLQTKYPEERQMASLPFCLMPVTIFTCRLSLVTMMSYQRTSSTEFYKD
jgi:hypothetical protein